jgi:hypothetical protein
MVEPKLPVVGVWRTPGKIAHPPKNLQKSQGGPDTGGRDTSRQRSNLYQQQKGAGAYCPGTSSLAESVGEFCFPRTSELALQGNSQRVNVA